MVTRHIYTRAYHRKKNTETPVKILILKQIYTETRQPSLEALVAQHLLDLFLSPAGLGAQPQGGDASSVLLEITLLTHLIQLNTGPNSSNNYSSCQVAVRDDYTKRNFTPTTL